MYACVLTGEGGVRTIGMDGCVSMGWVGGIKVPGGIRDAESSRRSVPHHNGLYVERGICRRRVRDPESPRRSDLEPAVQ